MACFSIQWLESLLIWFLIICFIVAVVKLIVPAMLSWGGGAPAGAGTVFTILGYLVWLVIAIAAVIFIFDLLSCLTGDAPLSLPVLRR